MEELNKVEKIAEHIKEYAETRFGLIVLTVQEKIADVLSSLLSSIIGVILTLFVLLFVSLGAALWLDGCFHSTSMGFFCVGGFYFIVAFIIILNKGKWIKSPILNELIKKMNSHEEN